MGERRFFQVESKSFELLRSDGELRITERGKNHLSYVTMGIVTARWFCDALLEVASISIDQNAFWSFREGNKVIVIQKQMNGKGRFVSVVVLGESKSKGTVIILEGKGTRGWKGFSLEVAGFLPPTVGEKIQYGGQRQPGMDPGGSMGQHNLNAGGVARSFKETVTHGILIPNISQVSVGNKYDSPEIGNAVDNDSMEIFLKVILGRGLENNWVVKWAGVLDSPWETQSR